MGYHASLSSCVFTCVFGTFVGVNIQVCVRVWSPEVDVKCPSQLFSILFILKVFMRINVYLCVCVYHICVWSL